MIISRTPFRISFIGGGSDLKEYYSQNKFGAVISTTIQKYMYIVIHPYFHDKIRLKYSITEDVNNVEEIKHPIIRECLKKVGVNSGIEITSFADIPAGTGLGSSSSFTVGLLNALYSYNGKIVTKSQLAEEACEIEISKLNEPIGKQDQYAASFGNLNYIKFNDNEKVDVIPIELKKNIKDNFESSLRLYYTGEKRQASTILNIQKNNMSKSSKVIIMNKMVNLTNNFKKSLLDNDIKLIGEILNDNWVYKKQMASNISNKLINNLYDKAIKLGAIGGKLLGAGGSGFLLIMAKNHQLIEKNLGCKSIEVKFDEHGSKIIYND